MRDLIAKMLLFAFASTVLAADSDRPAVTARDEYFAALISRKFQFLESEATIARETDSTVADGQPKLASLYAGVSGCLTSGCTNSLTGEQWTVRLQRLEEWKAEHPTSITAAVALASFPLEYGWAIRGQGPARHVPPDVMAEFSNQIDAAESTLSAIEKIGKHCPGWYVARLRAGRAAGWPRQQFESLYLEAQTRFPHYTPIYFEMATYLAPRWYGSIAEFRDYVNAVSVQAPETLKPILYARLQWLMSTNSMFEDGQADWASMKASFQVLIKQYPHPWNQQNYAKFACRAGDAAVVQSMKKDARAHPIPDAWGNKELYDYCMDL